MAEIEKEEGKVFFVHFDDHSQEEKPSKFHRPPSPFPRRPPPPSSSPPPPTLSSTQEINPEALFKQMDHKLRDRLCQAAKHIREADYMLITAGAGMGVPSGLGTFRGAGAFRWPPFERPDMKYMIACNPARLMEGDGYGGPIFGWSFWKNCIDSYMSTSPHQGYEILSKWTKRLDELSSSSSPSPSTSTSTSSSSSSSFSPSLTPSSPVFIFTSNIDGHFLRIPTFKNRIVECHGSAMFLQCQQQRRGGFICKKRGEWWEVERERDLGGLVLCEETGLVVVKEGKREGEGEGEGEGGGEGGGGRGSGVRFPMCRGDCGGLARPMVLMFGDCGWVDERTKKQEEDFEQWVKRVKREVKGSSLSVESSSSLPPSPPSSLSSSLQKRNKKVVAIEIGAGVALPTIRAETENFCKKTMATLIRINPIHPDPPDESWWEEGEEGEEWEEMEEGEESEDGEEWGEWEEMEEGDEGEEREGRGEGWGGMEEGEKFVGLGVGALEALVVLDWLVEGGGVVVGG